MSLKSPCVGVCIFDKTTGFCTACYRSKDEAKAWKKMSESEQEKIVEDGDRRMKEIKRLAQTRKNGKDQEKVKDKKKDQEKKHEKKEENKKKDKKNDKQKAKQKDKQKKKDKNKKSSK